MRPSKQERNGQQDLLRSRLDQIVDPGHPLAKLAAKIDWASWSSGWERFTPIVLAVRRYPPA